MEKKNFQSWLDRRQNILEEGVFDWLRNLGSSPKKPQSTGPNKPEEIYNDPEVIKYYNEILDHWGFNKKRYEIIDNKGNTIGVFDGKVPEDFHKALLRYIAGHIYGQGDQKSFMRISFHDASTIIDFLDNLRSPGATQSVADDYRIDRPDTLSLWFQSKLPTHATARLQQGYTSNQYLTPRQKLAQKTNIDSAHPELQQLAKTIADLVPNFFNTKGEPYRAPALRSMRVAVNAVIAQAKKVFSTNPAIMNLKEIPNAASASGGGTPIDPNDPGNPIPGGATRP